MAKQTILTERGTGEVMYPLTLASLVQTADGGNVDERLEEAKFALFIDMWNQAAGSYGAYNAGTGFFELNGLTDITYEEAVDIYIASASFPCLLNNSGGCAQINTDKKLRTAFPFKGLPNINLNQFGYYGNYIEVVRFIPYYSIITVSNLIQAFYNTTIKRVLTEIYVYNLDTNKFYGIGNPNLEYLLLKKLKCDLNLSKCAKLELYCFKYMVQWAANTSAITITVHPDVYAKLTGDTTNAAAAALTPEELVQWQQVLTDAAAKNITFAST